jgi:hypothetical protein
MRVRFYVDFTIEAARRNDEQLTVDILDRECRSAVAAEAFSVPGCGQVELPDVARPGKPFYRGGRRKQIGGVSRSGVFTAVLTMAEIKVREFACDFETNFAAEAGSGMLAAHFFSPVESTEAVRSRSPPDGVEPRTSP